jgi:hypothetical protein
MGQDYIVTGDTVTMGKHYCTTGSVFAGLRWVRKKVGGEINSQGLENYYYQDTLQQGVRCLECGKPHWTDVPIVEEENEE